MITMHRAACLMLAGTLVSSMTLAQVAPEATPPHVRTFASGDAKSTGASFGHSVALEAGDADGKATVNLSDFFTAGAMTHRYRVQVSAPFDRDKAASVDVGTLSGLSAGTSVSAEYSYVQWPHAPEDRKAAYEQLCESLAPKLIEGYPLRVIDALGDWDCNPEQLSEARLQHAVDVLRAKRAECTKGTLSPVICNELKPLPEPRLSPRTSEVLAGAPEQLSRLIDEITTTVSLWTLTAGANQQRFAYVLPAAPTTSLDARERGWSLGGTYTRLSDALLWSLGYSHERTYNAGDKTQICTPIGETTSLSCKDAVLGAPTRKDAEIAFAEVRWIAVPRKLAISPRLQFDLEDSEWAIRVPAYLLRNKAGAFTAGVALGYSSSEDEVGASVFVGKEFAFFD